MTEHKFTDEEIIQAYEGLTSNQQLNLFRNLYYNDGYTTERGIIANAINDILPQFHHQKAEIESKNDLIHRQSDVISEQKKKLESIYSEAIKEFSETVMPHIEDVLDTLLEVGNGVTDEMLHEAADKLFKVRNLVEETVGGERIFEGKKDNTFLQM